MMRPMTLIEDLCEVFDVVLVKFPYNINDRQIDRHVNGYGEINKVLLFTI